MRVGSPAVSGTRATSTAEHVRATLTDRSVPLWSGKFSFWGLPIMYGCPVVPCPLHRFTKHPSTTFMSMVKVGTLTKKLCSTQLIVMLFAVNGDLEATGQFEWMDLDTDENEHSVEMHLPYIAKVMEK